jgi:hypothetical protein
VSLVKSSESLSLLYSDGAGTVPMMDTQGKRIRWALEQRQKTATWLAGELGLTRGALSQWWKPVGHTSPDAHIKEIADLLDFNEEWLRHGTGMPEPDGSYVSGMRHLTLETEGNQDLVYILGEVGAGMYLAVADQTDLNYERKPSAFIPLAQYPVKYQYDLIVRGTSIDRYASDGDVVRCVSLQAGIGLESGDYVHVERYRHQRSEVENTIKRALLVNGVWELRFSSDDPRWAGQPPLILGSTGDEQVEVVGVAVAQYRLSPNRRNLG